jgi:hypothetical protein
MSVFTPSELAARSLILNSHLLFGRYLDRDITIKLVDLFESGKIADYIREERKLQIKDTTITDVSSMVYGEDASNSTLLIDISKNGVKFIHLTIHLSIKSLKSDDAGMLHIGKDIYYKGLSRSTKKKSYALIAVQVPSDKPNSLTFIIADGMTTPIAQEYQKYDPIIQQEMKVIIDILNNIFDETKPECYIEKGDDKLYTVHNKTNNVLRNINAHSKYYTRKNKNVYLFQHANNQQEIRINSRNLRGTSKRFQASNRIKPIPINNRKRLRTTQKVKLSTNMRINNKTNRVNKLF